MLTLGAKPGVFCSDQSPLALPPVFTFDDCALTKGSGIAVVFLLSGAWTIEAGAPRAPELPANTACLSGLDGTGNLVAL